MMEQNFRKIDDLFLSVEAEVPDSLKTRLRVIPLENEGPVFWDWSWGLPLGVLTPVILWLFVKNATVIGSYVMKTVEWLGHLPIPEISPIILLIFLGLVAVLTAVGISFYVALEDRMEDRWTPILNFKSLEAS